MERSQEVKTADFDSAIRRFKSSRSNQLHWLKYHILYEMLLLTARKDEQFMGV